MFLKVAWWNINSSTKVIAIENHILKEICVSFKELHAGSLNQSVLPYGAKLKIYQFYSHTYVISYNLNPLSLGICGFIVFLETFLKIIRAVSERPHICSDR